MSFVQGSGEPGSVRVVKLGPAIPNGGEVVERLDVLDEATKTVGYTVLKGDPRFKHVSAVIQFAPGPTAGTTTATWTATYVPVEEGTAPDSKFVVRCGRPSRPLLPARLETKHSAFEFFRAGDPNRLIEDGSVHILRHDSRNGWRFAASVVMSIDVGRRSEF